MGGKQGIRNRQGDDEGESSFFGGFRTPTTPATDRWLHHIYYGDLPITPEGPYRIREPRRSGLARLRRRFSEAKIKNTKKWKTTRPGLIRGKLERQETQSVALGVLLLPCWFAVFACRAAVIYSAPVPMSSATLVLVCCANLRIFENGARA